MTAKCNPMKENQETEDNGVGGPPTKEQLFGVWVMIDIPNSKEINKVNPWPMPYQWFYFSEEGKFFSMMKTESDFVSAKDLIEVYDVFSKDQIPNYQYYGQVITIDNPEIENYQELWGVNIFTQDYAFAKKGDLIMTLDDGKGEVIYHRLLRKLN